MSFFFFFVECSSVVLKGINLGYGSQVFPGVTQGLVIFVFLLLLLFFAALIDGDIAEAQQQLTLLAAAISRAAQWLQSKETSRL